MFFVHYYKFQVAHRGKDGGTGPQNHPCISALYSAPLIITLAGRELGVEDGNALSKAGAVGIHKMCRKGDFRAEGYCASARGENMGNASKIDLCLAASGDSP